MIKDIQGIITSGANLSASEKVRDAVIDCSTQLKTLEGKLDPGKTHKAMRRLGIRALK